MHLQNTAHSLRILLGGVVHAAAGVDGAGVDTEEAQLAHIGVGCDLKRQSGEGLFVGSVALFLFTGFGVHALDGGNVGGRRHVVDNGIQQFLNALVAVRSAAANGDHGVGQGAFADTGFDLLDGEFLTLQVFHHALFILLSSGFDHSSAVLVGLLQHILGDLFHTDILAQVIVVHIGFHLHQVDDAFEELLRADGQLDRDSVAFQPGLHHFNYVVKISAHNVHLVDIGHSGNLIFICLTPYGFRLGLNATLGTENCYRTIEYSKRTLNLYGKVNVTGGVDDINAVAIPVGGGSSGSDGNTSLLLLNHPVHGRAAVVGLTNLVIDACVIQDALSGGGFTSVNVGHYADVTCHFQRDISWHIVLLKISTQFYDMLPHGSMRQHTIKQLLLAGYDYHL